MKYILNLLLASGIFLSACGPKASETTEAPQTDTTQVQTTPNDPWASPTETISGTANGMRLIFQHNKYTEYRLITGTDTITGPLNTERGFENDEDATLYIVYHTFPDSVLWHFVRMTDGRYRMLDAKQKELPDVQIKKG